VSTIGPSTRARVRVLGHDPFGAFARAASRRPVRRLTIVSPWLCPDGPRPFTLRKLIERVDRQGGAVVLVTRPSVGSAHEEAIALVRAAERGTIYLNPSLHAKIFVCETGGGGLAVVGSANASAGSASLDELAILLRPEHGSRIITELASAAVRGLIPNRPARR
jgi:hypothetical protein